MKAVILAAGKGTRMKELTAEQPKPMLRVAGRPVLEHIVRAIAAAGVRDFLIITGYRAEVVESYFKDGKDFGVNIRYVRQEVASGTGSATDLAKDFISNNSFLLTYGDILTAPENYRSMFGLFAKGDFDGLVSTWHGEDLTKGGAVLVGNNGCVTDIVEKGKSVDLKNAFYNAGIYIFPSQIFPALAAIPKSPRGEYELTDAIRVIIRDGKRLRAFPLEGYWLDVRDPEALGKAEKLQKIETT